MAIKVHTWKITGTSPLLQNNPAQTLTQDDGGIKTGKKKYDDKEEASIRVYKNDKGEYVHPSAAFRSLLIEGSKGRKVNKKALKPFVAGGAIMAEPEVVLTDKAGKPLKTYSIHKCRCIVNKKGILRCRPQFGDWCCVLPIEIDSDLIGDPDVITQILNIGGRTIGIGDYRPDTSNGKSGVGTFGRFTAKLVQ